MPVHPPGNEALHPYSRNERDRRDDDETMQAVDRAPLMRAAMVGGVGYMAGNTVARGCE
jgi:hypothetical protein